jgi:hypothetical protein
MAARQAGMLMVRGSQPDANTGTLYLFLYGKLFTSDSALEGNRYSVPVLERTDFFVSDDIDWIARAGTKAKGKRPAYFEDPAVDRTLSIVMALVGEVSVLRERLDTVERLLDSKGTISRADIEAFEPDRPAGEDRGLKTREYIARVMRGVQQDMEALEELDTPSVEELSIFLRDS